MSIVAPYCGQTQAQHINVPASIAYKYIDWEESCWVMPPYSQIFGVTSQPAGEAWVPPPVKQTDIFTSMQTWPL
jgi:hypothetical protein